MTFDLGEGEKKVQVLLPWAVQLVVREVSLDDGASLVPVKPKYRMLCFGDSITQGYDAMYPSHKYATRLAAYLDAAEHNKAIGGEIFYPELAGVQEDYEPEYILVAYGTNDWSKCEKDVLVDNCTRFFETLCKTYPNAKVLALTPIWRKDGATPRRGMDFSFVAELLQSVEKQYDNVTVIPGIDLVDHDVNLYADLRLHPNDAGFICYADRLIREVGNR
jgi:lysophospholipase L1-like esterase